MERRQKYSNSVRESKSREMSSSPSFSSFSSRGGRGAFVHVPFRESKLTRFLEDSLGGDSVTAMVLTVSPNHAHVEEAVNTLAYANLATKILNIPKMRFDAPPTRGSGGGGDSYAKHSHTLTHACMHERTNTRPMPNDKTLSKLTNGIVGLVLSACILIKLQIQM